MPLKYRKTRRKSIAHLGEVDRVGIVPVVAWVRDGVLYFHRLGDRDGDPVPVPLQSLYRKHRSLTP